MTRKLVRSSAFVQAARRLLRKRPETAEDLRATLELLGLDAFHPRLKTHKLKGDLTLGQASRLAGMNRLQFQHLLASRQIPLHYDVAEFEEDLHTMAAMGRP